MSDSDSNVIDVEFHPVRRLGNGPNFQRVPQAETGTRRLDHHPHATRTLVALASQPQEPGVTYILFDDTDPDHEEEMMNANQGPTATATASATPGTTTAQATAGDRSPQSGGAGNGGQPPTANSRPAPPQERFPTQRLQGQTHWWIIALIAIVLMTGLWWRFSGSTNDSPKASTPTQQYPTAKPPAVKTSAQLRGDEAALRGQLLQMQRLNPRSPEKEWQIDEKIRAVHDQILALEAEESAEGTSINRGSRGKGLRADIDWDGNGRIVLEAEDNDTCKARLQRENALLQQQLQQKPQTVIINQTVPYGSRRLGVYR